MKNYYTPKKSSWIVACTSAAIILVGTIPAFAAFQPSRVTHESASVLTSPQKVVKNVQSALAAKAIANRPPVKPVPRPNPKALHAACLRGDLAAVQKLVKQRVNIHYANDDRETALHMAASRGHLAIVIFLLKSGANMNPRTTGNWIPLHHAVRFNRQSVANYLMAKGSPANYKTSDGVNSMDIALAMGNKRMIDLVGRYMHK
jgi:hypothetical protein